MDDIAMSFGSGRQRRMPVYLLLDTSGSMVGDPIAAVNQGVSLLLNELKNQPDAYELVWLSIITFDTSARQLFPLTELRHVSVPLLTASGATAMGEAFHVLSEALETEIHARLNEPGLSSGGDYKPLVFLLTDGRPTDDFKSGLAELKGRKTKKPGTIIAMGCGNEVDREGLQRVGDVVLLLRDVNGDNLKAYFDWVSQSINRVSKSVGLTGSSKDAVDALPPPPREFEIFEGGL